MPLLRRKNHCPRDAEIHGASAQELLFFKDKHPPVDPQRGNLGNALGPPGSRTCHENAGGVLLYQGSRLAARTSKPSGSVRKLRALFYIYIPQQKTAPGGAVFIKIFEMPRIQGMGRRFLESYSVYGEKNLWAP